jgi:quinol monooxygenase YgiN
MPIYQIARYTVRKESVGKIQTAIKEFVDYIRANEPGTLVYYSQQDTKDPASFVHYIIFADEAARHTHGHSEVVNHFNSILFPETLAPVEFSEWSLVAKK